MKKMTLPLKGVRLLVELSTRDYENQFSQKTKIKILYLSWGLALG